MPTDALSFFPSAASLVVALLVALMILRWAVRRARSLDPGAVSGGWIAQYQAHQPPDFDH